MQEKLEKNDVTLLNVLWSFGGKLKVLKSFFFKEKQEQIKIVPLLQNFFQGILQFYVTTNFKRNYREYSGIFFW